MVARRWRDVFAATKGLSAVANADDPHIVWAASVIPDVTWVSVGQRWTADSAVCPACGSILRRPSANDWACTGCGFRRPIASWSVESGALLGPAGVRYPLDLQLPGAANQANAAMAVVAANVLGVAPSVSLPALRTVASVGGRYQTVSLGGRRVRLLLGKNPAGWSEMFGMLAPAPAPVVIAINARAADGKDPSWLWDVPFERLADREVIATGDRRHDLAVRLMYAEVSHTTVADPFASGLAFDARLARTARSRCRRHVHRVPRVAAPRGRRRRWQLSRDFVSSRSTPCCSAPMAMAATYGSSQCERRPADSTSKPSSWTPGSRCPRAPISTCSVAVRTTRRSRPRAPCGPTAASRGLLPMAPSCSACVPATSCSARSFPDPMACPSLGSNFSMWRPIGCRSGPSVNC